MGSSRTDVVMVTPEAVYGIEIKSDADSYARPELAHIQERNNMPKYKEKSKKFVIDKILEKVPEETLQLQVCEELLQRDYTVRYFSLLHSPLVLQKDFSCHQIFY